MSTIGGMSIASDAVAASLDDLRGGAVGWISSAQSPRRSTAAIYITAGQGKYNASSSANIQHSGG
jgi:hypothetical protein